MYFFLCLKLIVCFSLYAMYIDVNNFFHNHSVLLIFHRYPAGFVYLYTALYYITSHGTNIRLGQYIFAALYIFSLIVVFDIYRRCKLVITILLVLNLSFSVTLLSSNNILVRYIRSHMESL